MSSGGMPFRERKAKMQLLSEQSKSNKHSSLVDNGKSAICQLSDKKGLGLHSFDAEGAAIMSPQAAMCHKQVSAMKAHRRCQRALRKLQELVTRAPRQRRREVLERIPLQARIALLRYMEQAAGQRKLGSTTSVHSCSRTPGRNMGGNGHKSGNDSILGRSRSAQIRKADLACGVGGLSSLKAERNVHVKKARLGVSLKAGGYLARARIAPYLDAVTCCQSSWAQAAELHDVLQRVKALAVFNSCDADEEEHLRACIDTACSEAQLTTSQLGLSFCALVDAHAVVGRTVAGSYSTDLSQVLAQRRRLLAARAEGWQSLRAEWIRVMQVPAPVRARTWGFARPRPKAAMQAEEIADAAEKAHIAKQLQAEERVWRRFLCQLARAADTVAAAVAAESCERRRKCAQAVHRDAAESVRARERIAQSRRERRWQWLNDPGRTMEEILGH